MFIGNPEADRMLTRTYREPFVVPEIGNIQGGFFDM
jgi:hypothetical protein